MTSPVEYKGMQFVPLYESDNVKRFVVEFDDNKKLVFSDVKFRVVLSLDSYKYDSEFQIQFWSRKKPELVVGRTPDHNGYFRGVGYFEPEEGKKLSRGLSGR